ncbi:hypothetical protein FEF65_11535 [Mariprofundus erugo]|uniref:Uncharacterized protein n=1 Tax=Mariprofundus erugo TaxID=2528639 RepID=A0A5R9GNR4_9PROT|nr:hypothetical protein [Mariprofundus erugo]TLS65947.1 hypothetical protein FEF65_11535 [Mariprofundus erugo]
MIRNIFLIVVFFFGPALVMFMLRNGLILLRLWLAARSRRQQPEIIDVTPVRQTAAPRWFYALAIVLGLIAAAAGFMALQSTATDKRQYIPAHVDAQGELVPGHWQPASE